jgi:hypothetical protein
MNKDFVDRKVIRVKIRLRTFISFMKKLYRTCLTLETEGGSLYVICCEPPELTVSEDGLG